jgi:hypothetical protein
LKESRTNYSSLGNKCLLIVVDSESLLVAKIFSLMKDKRANTVLSNGKSKTKAKHLGPLTFN